MCGFGLVCEVLELVKPVDFVFSKLDNQFDKESDKTDGLGLQLSANRAINMTKFYIALCMFFFSSVCVLFFK